MSCSHESNSQTIELEATEYEMVNNLDGVTMMAKKETVTSTGLTVVFENSSNKQIIYGDSYFLEKKINEIWYKVPTSIGSNYEFTDIGYGLDASEIQEWEVNWEWLYGSLNSGEYRIVKYILDFRAAGDYDKYHLTAEFTMK